LFLLCYLQEANGDDIGKVEAEVAKPSRRKNEGKLNENENGNDVKEIQGGPGVRSRGRDENEEGRQSPKLLNSVSILSVGVTPEETVLQLMSNCAEKLSHYDKLFFEFGVVGSKDCTDKDGEANVRAAAAEVSKGGLNLVRYCTLNLAKLATASLEKSLKTVLNCKSQRDFAKDSCPELQFSCRQFTGTF
jgi:hypothetical protein